MSELRAILVGIAVGLLALIWWWTARNSRQGRGAAHSGAVYKGAAHTGATRAAEPVTEPSIARAEDDPFAAEPVPAEHADRDWGVSPLEPLSIKTADFDRVPILEMPMMADIETATDRGGGTGGFAHATPPVLTQVAAVPTPRPAVPMARTDDSDRFAPVEPRSPNASEQQRIVTVRICAVGGERWSGRQLMQALESQGLAYGKYKIYHRRHADGRSLFCVASLIEPGTFDIALMPNQEFRGLSLFAVLPGPAEPVQTIDALLTTARGLAEELTAVVEDDQGLPLSPLRAAALREDVARFQAQLA